MFKNNNAVECFTYEINLEKPVYFICNLGFQIARTKDSEFKIEDMFNDSFLKAANIDISRIILPEEDYAEENIQALSSSISQFLSGEVLRRIDLSKTNILLLNQISKTIFVQRKNSNASSETSKDENNSKKLRTTLTELIRSLKIMDLLTNEIINQEVKDFINSTVNPNDPTLNFMELYFSSVQIKTSQSLDIPYINYTILDNTNLTLEPIESSDLWINDSKINDCFGVSLGSGLEPELIEATDSSGKKNKLGIKYGDVVFPTTPKSFEEFVLRTNIADYYWLKIKEVYRYQDFKIKEHPSKLLEDFKNHMKKPALNKLLSFLQYNLYIDSNKVPQGSRFSSYFDEVIKIGEPKHLTNYSFFVSKSEQDTALGIYANSKAEGITSYNLLHWYKKDTSKHFNYRDIHAPAEADLESVFALKPEISFYFVSRYFEDFLDLILGEIGAEYIKNFHLLYNGKDLGEFDFLIRKDNTLYFIEAKTKLRKEYIEEFQKKSSELKNAFKVAFPNIDVQFLLVSAYSSNDCEELRYFIDTASSRNKRYNTPTGDLGTTPYNFKVPIPNQIKAKITCIAEPEYGKLKTILKKICL